MTNTNFNPTHRIKRTNIPCIILSKGGNEYNHLCHIDTEHKGDCWVEETQIEEIK